MATGVDAILYPICTFLLGLYTLERSTAVFITATAHLASRLRVSETLISLLTAGAEWEELFVIIAALLQRRPHLALGNVLGSCLGNILGAFSLGVLVHRDKWVSFDPSARVYAAVLFAVTTGVACVGLVGWLQNRVLGASLVAVFVAYVVAVGWSIYRGILDAPEDSDDDDDRDSNSDPARDSDVAATARPQHASTESEHVGESAPLLPTAQNKRRSTLSYLIKLIIGFVALSMSGYVLSHSSTSLAASFKLSETVFGATFLSLATTVPEKFIAVMSGARGHPGIMVANTVGSNIFLLTLCLGVIILGSEDPAAPPKYQRELVWVWTSSAFLTLVIVVGSHRLVGATMLLAYVAFLGLELTT